MPRGEFFVSTYSEIGTLPVHQPVKAVNSPSGIVDEPSGLFKSGKEAAVVDGLLLKLLLLELLLLELLLPPLGERKGQTARNGGLEMDIFENCGIPLLFDLTI